MKERRMTAESKNNGVITRRQALALTGGALVASSILTRGASAGSVPGTSAQAKLTQVRNATLRIDYGGVRFLVDPLLAEKGAYPGFEGTANSHLRNPLVPLPMPLEDIVNVGRAVDPFDSKVEMCSAVILALYIDGKIECLGHHAILQRVIRLLERNTCSSPRLRPITRSHCPR
jgi:hypothetical protein